MSGLLTIQSLIVDDNRQMRLLVRSLLRALGMPRVYEAGDATEGFEVLRSVPIDLVITDLAMTPLDGIELTQMLRRAADSPNPYVTIIMLTGHSERAKVAAARDAGVSSFLVKPLSAKKLLDHINACMSDPRPFVRSTTYFGPDRRISADPRYVGPRRRANDGVSDDFDLDNVG